MKLIRKEIPEEDNDQDVCLGGFSNPQDLPIIIPPYAVLQVEELNKDGNDLAPMAFLIALKIMFWENCHYKWTEEDVKEGFGITSEEFVEVENIIQQITFY